MFSEPESEASLTLGTGILPALGVLSAKDLLYILKFIFDAPAASVSADDLLCDRLLLRLSRIGMSNDYNYRRRTQNG